MKECPALMQKRKTDWRLVNLKPSPPVMNSLIKIHKPNRPIRPVVNWKNAPAYNLAKFISTNIGKYIPLPNASNVRNSTDFISDIKNTDPNDKLRFVSFDIQNMYANIRVEDILDSTDT
jgi:hypothetical protein